MEAIEDAGIEDQLDLKNLLMIGRGCRQVITIEFEERKRQSPGLTFSEQTPSISTVEKGLLRGNRYS